MKAEEFDKKFDEGEDVSQHLDIAKARRPVQELKMVCWATGGPRQYTGRSMADAHRHLSITPQEWEAFLDDFQQTLDKFKVPAAEQAELRAIVQSTYGDIVVSKDV